MAVLFTRLSSISCGGIVGGYEAASGSLDLYRFQVSVHQNRVPMHVRVMSTRVAILLTLDHENLSLTQ